MKWEAPTVFRRPRVGWATALGAVGAGGVLLVAGLWFFRAPIAELSLKSMLSGRGVESDFRILQLDFGGAELADVRLGAADAPDATISSVVVSFGWSGLSPRLDSVRVLEPRLRLRMDEAGRVSAGALDHVGGSGGTGGRLELPAIALEIVDGQAALDAPFGQLTAVFAGQGRLGTDFQGAATIASTTLPGEAYALEAGHAELALVSQSNALAFRLTGGAQRMVWNGGRFDGATITATGRAPLDLSQAALDAELRLTAAQLGEDLSARGLTLTANAEGLARDDALAPRRWTGEVQLTAQRLAQGEAALSAARAEANVEGGEDAGQGTFSFAAANLAGFGLTRAAPSAQGAVNFNLRGVEEMRATAQVLLSRAQLNADVQASMRAALPDIDGMPFGPTMAGAERALDVAMDRFDLTAPLQLDFEGGNARLLVDDAIEARAPSGARIRAAPLRDDGPALVVRWPGTNLHASMAIEMAGGGLPTGTLLLDAADWAPGAPLEADGLLTISEWNADNASITTTDLDLSLVQQPSGEGTLQITGPARLSGPLADGSVRDAQMALALDIAWNEGWTVRTRDGCMPMTVGGLNTAGMAFNRGGFNLCARNTPLLAADARERLSGAFVLEGLALDGRMAGEAAQPVRLRAGDVNGRISGTLDDTLVAVVAAAPRLAIDMERDRTLSVTGRRVTADARFGQGSWRVDGLFDAGVLSDPALPGEVSAIAGRWSAAPEGNDAVIRVSAGEARVDARPAPPDAADQRPAFQPMLIADVEGVLRAGDVRAEGAVVLEEGGHRLARFTAQHDVDAGVGSAQVTAASITFDEDLQPFQITELARGVVANVRGRASAVADVRWDAETLTATGRVIPLGLSMAASTIPVIEDVRGEVYFDDLLTLHTPPGQTLNVGLINPGVAVRNGTIRFQLLGEQRVAIEGAEFDFAAGVLGVAPSIITLGADETRFELTLRDVDVAELIETLNFKDLSATGQVEGSFPLRLTRRTAFIENGVLRAAPGGGTIAYVGQAGDAATGMAAVAFDALRSFRYDSLVLTLNGDISGDVVTSVNFVGENTGRAVDLGEIAPVPGLGEVRASGVPFRFNVTITAPFRRLADTAASITNPRLILEQDDDESDDEAGPEPDGAPSP